jgi:beta-N-acetylhexosaminidase
MKKQRENFSNNQAWIGAYEELAARNLYHDVLVAFDSSGAQVGWTLMCSPTSVISNYFAFLHLLPSKEKTGLIACVGIDKNARKGGIGQAMLVAAMENMKKRGIEGVLIDWVTLKGFYESVGYEDYWKYDKYKW